MPQVNELFSSVSVQKYDVEKWRAQLKMKNPDGSWTTRTRVLETTGRDNGRSTLVKRAAEAEAEALRQQLNEEAAKAPECRITVAECVDAYVTSRVQITRSTLSHYRGLLKRCIAPRIGCKVLAELSKSDVRAWADWLTRNYSRSVAANSLRLLKASLAFAQDVDQNWISRNVAKNVQLRKRDEEEEHPRPNALTDAEYARVLSTVDAALNAPGGYASLPHMLAIKMALLSGMRRGELCALRWRDVDFSKGYVSVEHAIAHTDSEFYIKPPKSASSRRVIECPSELMRDLKRRRTAMQEQCLEAGVPFSQDIYVIGGIDGSWMKPPRLDDHWRPLSKTLAITGTQDKPVTFHCLRHTYATRLLQAHVDVSTVAALMGHSQPSITLNRYASTGSEAKRRAADILGETTRRIVASRESGAIVNMDRTGTEG